MVQLVTQGSPRRSQCCALLLWVMSCHFTTILVFTLDKSHTGRVKVKDGCTESLAARGNSSSIPRALLHTAGQLRSPAPNRPAAFPACKGGRGATGHHKAQPSWGPALRGQPARILRGFRRCWRSGHRYGAGVPVTKHTRPPLALPRTASARLSPHQQPDNTAAPGKHRAGGTCLPPALRPSTSLGRQPGPQGLFCLAPRSEHPSRASPLPKADRARRPCPGSPPPAYRCHP